MNVLDKLIENFDQAHSIYNTNKESFTEDDIRRHIFICLVTGIGFEKYAEIMAYNNIHIPSVSTLFERQHIYGNVIEDYVLAKIQELKDRFVADDDDIYAYDAAFSGRRGAKQACGNIADVKHNFICEIGIAVKDESLAGKFKTVIALPPDAPSSMLENNILRKLLETDTMQSA
ncbi:hypothetical protein TVAG_196130 [Trichomonas vaginalis G3]|uniref:Uncharacterized protein n=1 Tax=Trichomonas vaginalis (strain ATCC PRA-98 / G3) TaxID=412133 RepID=A2F4U5_TRIV3|nr:hypothetical protein TVAGG3_0088690 [Trichomonas vaginalis G3]EAY00053.1 hypothetical protein TVAG_196130 [Trichomonas vaginalis G3]KAI5543754.1 hypothetical protein TVAGG3_0088690 [Trichomonas vaginalis G3]|eukprot:XP_001312982.1 hypothetical protein [Trichomonas vaginalis G3]